MSLPLHFVGYEQVAKATQCKGRVFRTRLLMAEWQGHLTEEYAGCDTCESVFGGRPSGKRKDRTAGICCVVAIPGLLLLQG